MVYAALGDLMRRAGPRACRSAPPRRENDALIGTIQTITPVTHDLGAFKVRRTLPGRERTMVGPFIFVDQFGPARLPPGEGMDVRPHPHINLATVTYLFEGAIEHRDSLGTRQVIEPGAVNLMTAGKRHRPFRALAGRRRAPTGPSFYGMQTWLALPDGKEEVDPAFEHVAGDGAAAGRGRRRVGARADGHACGARRAGDAVPFADHLRRHRARRRRQRSRSTPRPTSAR